ncbi:MAG: hypothetical protein M3162_03785 [Thermoproteota archaeon]|nr:hypothetical protein [Thermoproteota archaeon]
MILFNNRKRKSNIVSNNNLNDYKSKDADTASKYKKAVKIGSSIAKTLTSRWNSQENPGKVYVGNRRVHHGAIGNMLGFSKYFKKSDPTITGILSGIGEGLTKDDYDDRKEWFKFRKKQDEENTSFPPSTTTSPSTSSQTKQGGEETNAMNQQGTHNNEERKNDKSSG